MRRLLLTFVMLVTACEQHAVNQADRTSVNQTRAADEKRNADFWKEVAGIRFKEDRSHRGELLPAMPLVDGSGRATSLAALRGKPMLVNFWAHWCVPCRAEMPTIDAMAIQRGDALRVVAVNADVRQPASKSLGPVRMSPAILQLVDRRGDLAGSLAAGGLPTTILYDSAGRERWRLVGVLDWTKPQAQGLLREAT